MPGSAMGPTITVAPNTTTTYTVTGTDANNCRDTAKTVITVIPAPQAATVTPSSATICVGDSITLRATSKATTFSSGTQASMNTINGDASSYPAPYTLIYGGQRMQMLILASELSAAGFTANSTLNSIQFPVVSRGTNWSQHTNALQNLQISIGSTTLASISAFQTGLTPVYASYWWPAHANVGIGQRIKCCRA